MSLYSQLMVLSLCFSSLSVTAKLARLIPQNIASGGSSTAYRGFISDSSSLTDEATLDNVAASAIAVYV